MRSPLGSFVARPWFDRVALRVITRRLLPLSRAWAAARVAAGSIERFFAEVPLADRADGLRREAADALARIGRLDEAAAAAARRWEAAAFGPGRCDGPALAEAERARLAAANALRFGSGLFRFLLRRGLLPAVRFAVATPGEVESRYGADLAAPERAYAAPVPLPEVTESGHFSGPDTSEYWIRFPSPSEVMGDTVYARVREPEGVADPPTLIFGHGLFVEAEHLQGMPDFTRPLSTAGCRVVEMEAPWHGRRTPPGAYGGERFVAGAPLSAIDLFSAQVREIAVLVDWCRRTSRGAVAVGGISLGALAGQLVGVHAAHWPASMRPDALLLVTSCDRLDEVVRGGSLSRGVGLPEALAGAGWTPEALTRLRPLSDPTGDPALAPEDMVVVLGSRDDVTPFTLGKALFARWKVPRENLFVRRQGHFSGTLGMLRDTRHFHRVLEILRRKSPAAAGRPGALAR
ncbi:MAG: hypothetical protein ACE5H8_09365 [Alphaproteobacteria bacterium]